MPGPEPRPPTDVDLGAPVEQLGVGGAPTGDPGDPDADTATDARPPRPGLRERMDRVSLLARRQRWWLLTTVAVVALLAGVVVGRTSAPGPEAVARQAIETQLVPEALDADAVWTTGGEGRGPVNEALVALRREGDPAPVEADLQAWLDAYDLGLTRLAGLDLPPIARPVQRQFIAAVALSRDAVEVLGHAATVDDDLARHDLTTEVGRLRQRSEQLFQAARAASIDLDDQNQRADTSPLGPVRSFEDGRAP
jgi:hypothetical protein